MKPLEALLRGEASTLDLVKLLPGKKTVHLQVLHPSIGFKETLPLPSSARQTLLQQTDIAVAVHREIDSPQEAAGPSDGRVEALDSINVELEAAVIDGHSSVAILSTHAFVSLGLLADGKQWQSQKEIRYSLPAQLLQGVATGSVSDVHILFARCLEANAVPGKTWVAILAGEVPRQSSNIEKGGTSLTLFHVCIDFGRLLERAPPPFPVPSCQRNSCRPQIRL